ncbi:MAG: hypothetical protein LBF36_03180 [Mycoplasmataceae bacterium]|jgi:hypothetical protein|nr:hypothetical protein [Mycoplasmataceae bacterium]
MKDVGLLYKHALKNLFLHWTTYFILLICLIVTMFIIFILPTVLPSMNIALFYNQPAWLTVIYPPILFLIVLLSALVSECVVNKSKMIYIVTKHFSRAQYLWSQFLATFTIVLPYVLLIFLSLVGINLYLVQTNQGDLFKTGVYWYGVLTSLLISMFLGMSAVVWHLGIRIGVSTLLLSMFIAIFVILFPMIWYVDSTDDSIADPHRLWFTFYGPLTIYLPMTILLYIFGVVFFLKKRINP